ncbi:hypothetical protein [Mucilaginibacter dorajii]|uniref:TetR family transcriptional regulator n=1 Tax=Mucilaginibacter dorajii TaxID=692994 RepID=A0ABP7QYR2_9SPHI|nr:hypothetical protein [Mucilaginibacter dorajii]MCS3732332.1 AcrR family transcriptional regulator [Mucilaginibacter dorajii]
MKNKDDSKQKIINAVGKIFRTEGPAGLYYTRIAREAGVDRALVSVFWQK